jgi:hypothetical protein
VDDKWKLILKYYFPNWESLLIVIEHEQVLISLSFNFLGSSKRYSLSQSIQAGSGAHPSSCSWGSGEGGPFSLAVRQPGHSDYHSRQVPSL